MKDLVREGLVGEKPTEAGSHVLLDPRRFADVDRVINGEEL